MGFLLLVGAFGAGLGFFLGVFATVVCRASDAERLPTRRACAYPHGACVATQDSGSAP